MVISPPIMAELLRDLLDRKPSVLITDLCIGKMILFGGRVNNSTFLLRPDITGGQQHKTEPEKEHSA